MRAPMMFRFIRDSVMNRTLWEPKPYGCVGTPVRSMTYSCYLGMIAEGYGYEIAKPVHEPRKFLKVAPPVDFSTVFAMMNAKLVVSGYTVDGTGTLRALRARMESGVEIDITPEVD